MRDRRMLTLAWFFSMASLVAGCGRSGPTVTTVPVAGTVYLDEKPLSGVSVVFIGEGMKFVGMGTTGPDGKYELNRSTIPGKQGAMPGRNQVYFAKADENASEGPPMVPPTFTSAPQPTNGPLPAKYCNPAKPELTFDVPQSGTPTADFRLSSK